MSKKTKQNTTDARITFTMHPRVFAALGADLVTSDVIALMELVKNSYDAGATRVHIRIGQSIKGLEGAVIEVEDNGSGMDRSTIESVWSVVATPHRKTHPVSRQGRKTRRVTGEKGLGRLSAARLGRHLEMLTQSAGKPCWFVSVNWEKINAAARLEDCALDIVEYNGKCPWKKSGTLVRISGLRLDWAQRPEEDIDELKNQLGRFLPPFLEKDDIQVWITLPDRDTGPTRVERPRLIDNPPYRLTGSVDGYGNLTCLYKYDFNGRKRQSKFSTLLQRYEESSVTKAKDGKLGDNRKTACGPFSFELRVWDLDKDVLLRLSERFNYKGKIHDLRQLISKGAYSGVSLYRDGVLVLPKTESSSDWLGLNLRRVSRVGTRLSVNQIIGYIEIQAENNANLRDTSDRERLVDNDASREFSHFVFQVVEKLENERVNDRQDDAHKEPPFTDLFEEIRDRRFRAKIVELVQKKAPVEQFSKAADEHERTVDRAVEKIQTRLFYYSRLASLGTLAGILQHETGNHSVTMDDFLNRAERFLKRVGNAGKQLLQKLGVARQSLRSVQRLSDTFAPLASQAYVTRKRNCVFEETTRAVVAMLQNDLQKHNIDVNIPQSKTMLAVDPGEVSAIMLNLVNNSIFWLSRERSDLRSVVIEIEADKKSGRAFVLVHDSGPGIQDGDEERIFWPGITRKPNGLGMGLTVASELVDQYGGKMRLAKPGKLDGATFVFDLPFKSKKT